MKDDLAFYFVILVITFIMLFILSFNIYYFNEATDKNKSKKLQAEILFWFNIIMLIFIGGIFIWSMIKIIIIYNVKKYTESFIPNSNNLNSVDLETGRNDNKTSYEKIGNELLQGALKGAENYLKVN